ncbi:type II toxin-antitoxin system mRNA interferase toxin, RelE/StbE family [Crocosphaera sp. UHCC 0190]|uniref:type II toxin-antitoxin system RelE family toxin n=1 Tax=unclassified Crocosphaera TaxID=2623705 RepID=UPI002B21CAA5|nr:MULTISPECIES: type II toxin-antitoxin system mRNA interferase toxin, RelE/StbE family [unclassified Crocosphaera]MEA5512287.1 type II toxin-antitoxin system mRNA interferase toxin, RelE/StbE family [Crocosphaera sp. UHCC 0190]MEA5536379.1 type II toxin-antitoxin system mRNA interferase toxin, RelE/StbE family [Crocosphaera sp. XPORK-15E]
MKIKFESKFAKDLKKIKDKKLLLNVKESINECKLADSLSEINNLKKLKGYQTFYRLKIGDYRIGIEITNNELIFVRFLHRKEVYRFFP